MRRRLRRFQRRCLRRRVPPWCGKEGSAPPAANEAGPRGGARRAAIPRARRMPRGGVRSARNPVGGPSAASDAFPSGGSSWVRSAQKGRRNGAKPRRRAKPAGNTETRALPERWRGIRAGWGGRRWFREAAPARGRRPGHTELRAGPRRGRPQGGALYLGLTRRPGPPSKEAGTLLRAALPTAFEFRHLWKALESRGSRHEPTQLTGCGLRGGTFHDPSATLSGSILSKT